MDRMVKEDFMDTAGPEPAIGGRQECTSTARTSTRSIAKE